MIRQEGQKFKPSLRGIEFNDQFLHAFHAMEGKGHLFITGRAGTGKSTLLNLFREETKKKVAVLAPTGVAAVNIKGQTIHSFFNFKPSTTPHTVREIRPKDEELYRELDTIVIDEVSMVRADLLDAIDAFLRIHGRDEGLPFGGIQMIFIGDLYQLPPVVTSEGRRLFRDYYKGPYFFNARVFEDLNVEFIELEKVYRQRDEAFVDLLNRIRNNTVTEEDLKEINKRWIPDFQGEGYIYLTTTNSLAEGINREKLEEIRGKPRLYRGRIEGNFPLTDLPTGLELTIKVGAQVMLLNNDPYGRWINGSIGRVVEIVENKGEEDIILVEMEGGGLAEVLPHTWETFEFFYDRGKKRILSRAKGRFTQYPLRLAWAITVHKSQGLTFDKVVIDIGRGTFSHGQLYVALSRCTSLEGIVLKRPVERKHLLMDRRVVDFVTTYQYRQAMERHPVEERIALIEKAIEEGRRLEILYLKREDEKTRRIIIPSQVGEMEYMGKRFPGVRAFCTKRMEERVFHIERILEMRLL